MTKLPYKYDETITRKIIDLVNGNLTIMDNITGPFDFPEDVSVAGDLAVTGTITGNVTGNATSANKVNHSLTAGTHLSGGSFDGSSSVTLTTDGTASHTASTIMLRDANSRTAIDGIQFPATQNPSSDPNCLDDYEEGTWTPTDASGAALAFSTAVGAYTKTGRYVIATCRVSYPATGDGSNAKIGGLPFTVANDTPARLGFIGLRSVATLWVLVPAPADVTFILQDNTNTAITNATMSNGTFFGALTFYI